MNHKSPPISHHIKGISPVLSVMQSMGLDSEACLDNTGISQTMLSDPEAGITLEQEFQFYRNILTISDDPLIGLKLGEIFRPEAYGLYGYAILSAKTLRESLQLAAEMGTLNFSHYRFLIQEDNNKTYIAFTPQYALPPDLIQIYSDRDIQAAITASQYLQGIAIKPRFVYLIHNDLSQLSAYQDYFECPVILGHHQNELHFDRALLDTPLPKHDMETSRYFQDQCQLLLEKLGGKSSLIESVRELLIASPGQFPSIEDVAAKLNYSVRSLRRHLDGEGSSYRQLLNEIRNQLAQEYLATNMSIEQIAELLGYTEPGNFSHAFKRWHGLSPKQYRQKNLSN
ncbi:MAG: AraC family transcriptional regulator [Candidatus Pelagadaptatus aseana]|uniref:AraC family transcriptional regulator n=1 Tax=Candidatus Pelagadaptatus aseana TaxID=3120508 RepID=UPI0039B2FB5A